MHLYSDVNAQWVAFESNVTTQWSLSEDSNRINGIGNSTTGSSSSVYSWTMSPLLHRLRLLSKSDRFVSLQNAYEFAEENDASLRGDFTYPSNAVATKKFTYQSVLSANLRFQYFMQHSLQDVVDSDYRPSTTRGPAFAYAHDFGMRCGEYE